MSEPNMHRSSDDWNKLKHLVDLSAENARLKAEVGELCEAIKLASEVGIKIADEVTRLKAEVERLRKAGDDLYKSMLEIGCNEMADNFQYDAWWGSMRSWQSAKEGKQP